MSTAVEPKLRWNTSRYMRIRDARYRAGALTVDFADQSSAIIDVDRLVPNHARGLNWEAVRFEPFGIVVPTDSDDVEVSWLTLRSLTDTEFAAYLEASAKASAARIGVRVRELREDHRLAAPDLAARANVSSERLSRIEAGTDGISLPTLERIVTAMGHDMRVFVIHGEDEPPASR